MQAAEVLELIFGARADHALHCITHPQRTKFGMRERATLNPLFCQDLLCAQLARKPC